MILQDFDMNFRFIMDHSWMKVNRLGPMYEKGFLEFCEYTEQNLPNNTRLFYCPCVLCENTKSFQRKKYSIINVVMEFVKIIQYECSMVKWIKIKM